MSGTPTARAVRRLVPAAGWLRGYDRTLLGADVLAGVTAGSVVIPQALGYATIAGVPVQFGLYTCVVPMVAYALLGGARRLSMSTTSTIVALSGLGIAATGAGPGAVAGVATTLTLLVGLALLGYRILRLGWVVDAISDTVVAGLKVGVGLTIIADQLPSLLGISAADGGFFADAGTALTSLGQADPATALLGLGTVAGLLTLRRWAPRVPGPLLALAAGIGLVALLGLDEEGVALIPEVPRGLPLPALPPLDHVGVLLPYALAIALLAYMETIAVGRSTRAPTDPPLRNNQELVAAGAASVAGACFQTVPAAGGFSQTMVNADAGARTQVSGLVTAALAVTVALFLAPVLSDLPAATLGAVVVVAVAGLISLPELVRIGRIDRTELAVALATGTVALATNLLVGVVAGVVLTLYLVLRHLNHPVVVELRRPPGAVEMAPARPGDQPVPGLLAVRVEGGLYTMNVRSVQARILELAAARQPAPKVVLLDAGGTVDTSVMVMDTFAETDQQLTRQGMTLWVAALPTRALAKVRRAPAWAAWAQAGKLHPTVPAAVEAYQRRYPS